MIGFVQFSHYFIGKNSVVAIKVIIKFKVNFHSYHLDRKKNKNLSRATPRII